MTLILTPSCQQQKELSLFVRGKLTQLNLVTRRRFDFWIHFCGLKILNIGYREGKTLQSLTVAQWN